MTLRRRRCGRGMTLVHRDTAVAARVCQHKTLQRITAMNGSPTVVRLGRQNRCIIQKYNIAGDKSMLAGRVHTVKNIRIFSDILWRVFGILTEPVPYTFASVNRRNNEVRAHTAVTAVCDNRSNLLLTLIKQEAFEKCWAHSPLRAASRPFTRGR